MFEESNLHSLITRESRVRGIPLGKLLRESLAAAARGEFTVRPVSGELAPQWREELRNLALIAETQRDWGWWHNPTWSKLKLLLVKDAAFLAWLDSATPAGPEKNESEESAPQTTATTPASKPAPETRIDEAINAEYDAADQKGLKPPNLKELVAPVQKRLEAQGLHASGRQIQRLADAEKFKKRRRKPGATVASEKNSRNS
jgi:hypothetical protein